jgi:hypothetical protein
MYWGVSAAVQFWAGVVRIGGGDTVLSSELGKALKLILLSKND